MSDEIDYTSQHEPNEDELMKVFDAYLGGASREVMLRQVGLEPATHEDVERWLSDPGIRKSLMGAPIAEPSILDIQLAQAAERQGRRRVNAEGKGIPAMTPGSPLEQFAKLSDPAKQAVIDAIQKAKVAEVKRSTDDPVIPPPSDLRPEDVDRMIDEAWAKPSLALPELIPQINTVLSEIREAIGLLRQMPEDPIFRQALTNLEMAAIGVAMRGQKDG